MRNYDVAEADLRVQLTQHGVATPRRFDCPCDDACGTFALYGVNADDSGHSATFPVDLIRPRILSSCPPGGLVLDPFCGTGRALTVAEAAGRRAIGFDLRNWSTVT